MVFFCLLEFYCAHSKFIVPIADFYGANSSEKQVIPIGTIRMLRLCSAVQISEFKFSMTRLSEPVWINKFYCAFYVVAKNCEMWSDFMVTITSSSSLAHSWTSGDLLFL